MLSPKPRRLNFWMRFAKATSRATPARKSKVTSIGLDIRPSANKKKSLARTRHFANPEAQLPKANFQTSKGRFGIRCLRFLWSFREADLYPQSVNIKEEPAQCTSLRSEIHATDSTCNGCSANNVATNAHGQKLFACLRVIRRSRKNSSSVFAMCSNTLV